MADGKLEPLWYVGDMLPQQQVDRHMVESSQTEDDDDESEDVSPLPPEQTIPLVIVWPRLIHKHIWI